MKNKQVNELVGKIEEAGLITISGAEATVVEGAVEKLLPEGLSKEQFEQAGEVKENIVSALAIAFGKQSKAAFDADAKLETIEFSAPVDKVTTALATIRRKHTVKNNFAKEGEPETIERHGYITVQRQTKSPVSDSTVRKEVASYWSGVSN